MDIENVLAAATVLSVFNERLLEYTLGRWHSPGIDRALPPVSLALGVIEALAFQLNAIPAEWRVPVIVGQVATGIALALGSNTVHWLAGRVIKS